MKKKARLFIVTLIYVCFVAVSVHADESETYSFGHFYYHVHDGYVSISGYLGNEEEITIPSSISGKPVSEIEDGAFDGCDTIKTVVIPDTVTRVYENSFTGAGALKKIISNTHGITIPAKENVEIEYTAGKPSSDTEEKDQSENLQTADTIASGEQVNPGIDGETAEAQGNGLESDYKETSGSSVIPGNTDGDKENTLGQGAYVEEDNADIALSDSNEKKNRSDSSARIISDPENNKIIVRDTEQEYILSVDKDGHLVRQDSDGSIKVIDKEHKYSVIKTDDGEVLILDEAGETILPESFSNADDIEESISANNTEDADQDEEKSHEEKADNTGKAGFYLTIIVILLAFIVIGAVLISRLREKT